MRFSHFLYAVLACVAAAWPLAAQERRAGDPPPASAAQDRRTETLQAGEQRVQPGVMTMMKASELSGLKACNKEGKDLASVKDLVVELRDGDIRYVATTYGGFAGIGNKLFAVPWEAMTFKYGENEHFFCPGCDRAATPAGQGFRGERLAETSRAKGRLSICGLCHGLSRQHDQRDGSSR